MDDAAYDLVPIPNETVHSVANDAVVHSLASVALCGLVELELQINSFIN